jgi:hypothetical protein
MELSEAPSSFLVPMFAACYVSPWINSLHLLTYCIDASNVAKHSFINRQSLFVATGTLSRFECELERFEAVGRKEWNGKSGPNQEQSAGGTTRSLGPR